MPFADLTFRLLVSCSGTHSYTEMAFILWSRIISKPYVWEDRECALIPRYNQQGIVTDMQLVIFSKPSRGADVTVLWVTDAEVSLQQVPYAKGVAPSSSIGLVSPPPFRPLLRLIPHDCIQFEDRFFGEIKQVNEHDFSGYVDAVLDCKVLQLFNSSENAASFLDPMCPGKSKHQAQHSGSNLSAAVHVDDLQGDGYA